MAAADLTLDGVTWTTEFSFAESIHFDGTNDFATAPYDAKLAWTDAFTINFWAKSTALHASNATAFRWDDSQGPAVTVELESTGEIGLSGDADIGTSGLDTKGRIGTGIYSLDGTDDYFSSAGLATVLNGASAATFGAWVDLAVAGDKTILFGGAGGSQAAADRYGIFRYSGTTYVVVDDGGVAIGYGSFSAPAEKCFLCVVYDGGGATDADKLKVYCVGQDGVADQQSIAFGGTIPATMPTAAGDVLIGRWDDSTPFTYHTGTIHSLQVWNIALSQSEVAEAAFSFGTVQTSNLKGAYYLDSLNGGTDKSGNANDLTVNGSPVLDYTLPAMYSWTLTSGATLKTYYNGILWRTDSSLSISNTAASPGGLKVGYNGASAYYGGDLSRLKFHSSALTHANIKTLLQDGTVATYWNVNCDEGSGTTAADTGDNLPTGGSRKNLLLMGVG